MARITAYPYQWNFSVERLGAAAAQATTFFAEVRDYAYQAQYSIERDGKEFGESLAAVSRRVETAIAGPRRRPRCCLQSRTH